MDNWTFGFTMIIVGMGGTIVTLGLFALMMALLKKIFPAAVETPPTDPAAQEAASPEEEQQPQDSTEDEAAPC